MGGVCSLCVTRLRYVKYILQLYNGYFPTNGRSSVEPFSMYDTISQIYTQQLYGEYLFINGGSRWSHHAIWHIYAAAVHRIFCLILNVISRDM